MPIDISPGKYIIVPSQAAPHRVVGMTPLLHAGSGESVAQGKPVLVVPDNYPEYTRIWELTAAGTLTLPYFNSGLSALEENRLVFLGSPAEKWTVRTVPALEGRRQIIQNKAGLSWALSNPNEGQPELAYMPDVHPPLREFLFEFKYQGPLSED